MQLSCLLACSLALTFLSLANSRTCMLIRPSPSHFLSVNALFICSPHPFLPFFTFLSLIWTVKKDSYFVCPYLFCTEDLQVLFCSILSCGTSGNSLGENKHALEHHKATWSMDCIVTEKNILTKFRADQTNCMNLLSTHPPIPNTQFYLYAT